MLRYDTKLLLYDGTVKEICQIQKNDILMSITSSPLTIKNIAFEYKTSYFINPINKTDGYYACEDQILPLVHTTKHNIDYITIKDYIPASDGYKHLYKLYKTYCEFKENNHEFSPYIVGLYLGNGTKSTPCITTNLYDVTIINYINKYFTDYEYRIKSNNMLYRNNHSIMQFISGIKQKNNFREFIKTLLTSNNERFIPANYLIDSYNNRLNLLAGLLDADGYYDKINSYDIICKDKSFQQQVLFLARSLGLHATETDKLCKIKSLNFERIYYRICISGFTSIVPCKLPRKQGKERKQKKNPLRTGFKIKKDKEDMHYKIELNENNLLLLNNFMVIHN